MGDIPMPGGWMLSMAWVPMCGQTWLGAAMSFVGMWAAMMVAMMLPSTLPALWRHGPAGGTLVAAGYFGVWTALGAVVFAAGAALAHAVMQNAGVARAAPASLGLAVVFAGAFQFSASKARHLAGWQRTAACAPAHAGAAWRHGVRLGLQCSRACAGLTVILLALGVMDWRAMALVTAAITAERLLPEGERIAWAVGAVAIAAGACMAGRAALLA